MTRHTCWNLIDRRTGVFRHQFSFACESKRKEHLANIFVILLTPSVFGAHAGSGEGLRSQPQHLLPHTQATSISNWLSASLRHFTMTPRAILRRVRLAASSDASMTPGADDWCPAWDDPDSGAWSTEYDSLLDLNVASSPDADMAHLSFQHYLGAVGLESSVVGTRTTRVLEHPSS